jgi:hypothetical protein
MNARSGHGAASSPFGVRVSSRPFAFWVLQVTELVVAFILVEVSVHVNGGSLLVAAAGILAVLAVTAQGPLGLLRICSQRFHVALALGASVLVAAAPIVPALRPDLEGIIVIEFAAIGVIRVATLTRTREYPSGVPKGRRDTQPVIETTASVVEPGAPRQPLPQGGPPIENTARRAGRAAGTAAASGRRLWARHGPAVESRTKQVVRKAGRWAGKATGPAGDSSAPGNN